MTSELNTTNVNVVTDADIAIINEVFVPVDEQQYHVKFNVTWDRFRESTIRNTTFRNLHLYLDNSKGSINIEKNKFNGSGITMFRNVQGTTQVQVIIMIHDNLFQGEYQRPILEFRNTGNISLEVNNFKNLRFTFPSAKEEELNSGILCFNSQIKISDSTFKHVKLDTVFLLNHCIIEMVNVAFLENTPPVLNTSSTVINVVNSRGNFSDVMFAKNEGSICMDVRNGELLVHNIFFSRNELASSGTMMNIRTSNISLVNITAVINKGNILSITKSSGNISTSTWEQNSGNGTLLEISDSDIDIDDSLFADNFEFKDSQFILLKISDESSVTIKRSDFLFNKAKVIVVELPQGGEISLPGSWPSAAETAIKPSMSISSCRFEGNYGRRKAIIFGFSGVMQFFDSIFINNTVTSENDFKSKNGIFGLRYTSAIVETAATLVVLENCEVLHNNANGSAVFISIQSSSVFIIDCRFTNNSASKHAGVIYVNYFSHLTIQRSVFDSNSCGSDGGAIYAFQGFISLIDSNFTENRSFYSDGGALYLTQFSNVTSENCTFSGNNAAMEGGAVVVTDRSTYRDKGSLFISNTASNNGKFEDFSFFPIL